MHAAFPKLLEEQTLLDCVRANPGHDRIREGLSQPAFDWECFWALAGEQQVQPLVARVLASPDFRDLLPPDAVSALHAVRLQTTATNLASDAELRRVIERLREHDIDAVPLKGTRLAQRLFGAYDARRCGDIDLLVPERDWDTAHRLLCEAGYAPAVDVRPGVSKHSFHDVPLVRTAGRHGYVVELHRQLSDPRFVAIDYQWLWGKIRERSERTQQPLDLPTEALLIFLAVHAPKHYSGLLRLLADIDHLIAREVDELVWDDVVRIAHDWHADAILYFVLSLASGLLETPIPAATLRELQPPRWRRVVVPMLAGPVAVLRPPMPANLRANRFRLAYCLMLRHSGRELRSYWHYIVMPPQATHSQIITRIALAARRPIDGMAWTTLAIGSAVWDRIRVCSPARSG